MRKSNEVHNFIVLCELGKAEMLKFIPMLPRPSERIAGWFKWFLMVWSTF